MGETPAKSGQKPASIGPGQVRTPVRVRGNMEACARGPVLRARRALESVLLARIKAHRAQLEGLLQCSPQLHKADAIPRIRVAVLLKALDQAGIVRLMVGRPDPLNGAVCRMESLLSILVMFSDPGVAGNGSAIVIRIAELLTAATLHAGSAKAVPSLQVMVSADMSARLSIPQASDVSVARGHVGSVRAYVADRLRYRAAAHRHSSAVAPRDAALWLCACVPELGFPKSLELVRVYGPPLDPGLDSARGGLVGGHLGWCPALSIPGVERVGAGMKWEKAISLEGLVRNIMESSPVDKVQSELPVEPNPPAPSSHTPPAQRDTANDTKGDIGGAPRRRISGDPTRLLFAKIMALRRCAQLTVHELTGSSFQRWQLVPAPAEIHGLGAKAPMYPPPAASGVAPSRR